MAGAKNEQAAIRQHVEKLRPTLSLPPRSRPQFAGGDGHAA